MSEPDQTFVEVTVLYTEMWERRATAKIDIADFRAWSGQDEGELDLNKVQEYLEAENDSERDWPLREPPGNERNDDFVEVVIDEVRLP